MLKYVVQVLTDFNIIKKICKKDKYSFMKKEPRSYKAFIYSNCKAYLYAVVINVYFLSIYFLLFLFIFPNCSSRGKNLGSTSLLHSYCDQLTDPMTKIYRQVLYIVVERIINWCSKAQSTSSAHHKSALQGLNTAGVQDSKH
ncbi:hypothetical protein KUTeg_001490 [Tegillarca granosa]|uniref:Uncharacterized protein n=1 Tax=Tegillarca granosa TaxID=220873 RepID=A0ABQ9FW25_TEGGR|nr:hypothetical protein KUTeg_001490 [Tegillarca granosa]